MVIVVTGEEGSSVAEGSGPWDEESGQLGEAVEGQDGKLETCRCSG